LTADKAVALLRLKFASAPKDKLDKAAATLVKVEKTHHDEKKKQEEAAAAPAKEKEAPAAPKGKVEDAPAQKQPKAGDSHHHVAEGQKITDELIENIYKGSGILSQDKLTLTKNDRHDEKYLAFKRKVYMLMIHDAQQRKGEYFPGVPP